ncbi:hypothetical protein KKF91_20460 [Myxococcota bacterium]|nr:hypothetical protein [Myxococcota bacterium]
MHHITFALWLSLTSAHGASLGWADQDDIVVIQRLPYERAGRWALTPFIGMIANDPFTVDLPVGGRFGRFLNESLMLEVSGAFIGPLSIDRDLRRRVGQGDSGEVRVTLKDHALGYGQVSANWTALSAKAWWLGGEILYLRGHLLAGFGAAWVEADAGAPAARAEALFGLGFEAHLSARGSLRVELRQTAFQRLDGGALTPTEISLGWSYYLGGPLAGAR